MVWMFKQKGYVPDVCTTLVAEYLAGINGHLHQVVSKVCFFSWSSRPSAWKSFANKMALLLNTTKRWHVGTLAPLHSYRYADGTREMQMVFRDYTGLEQRVFVEEAVVVEGFPEDVLEVMATVVQPSVMTNLKTFMVHFRNKEALLPYAAVVAGFSLLDARFQHVTPPDWMDAYCLRHFLILGRIQIVYPQDRFPSWVYRHEPTLLDVLRYLALTRNFGLLQKFEGMLDFDETSHAFAEETLVTLVRLRGYKKVLSPSTLGKQDLLYRALVRLLDLGATQEQVMKYECMVNLNVRTPDFRDAFNVAVRERAQRSPNPSETYK
jgi:hypothetical protein